MRRDSLSMTGSQVRKWKFAYGVMTDGEYAGEHRQIEDL